MENNNTLHASVDATGQSSVVLDGILFQTISDALSFDHNHHNLALVGYPLLSTYQGDSVSNSPYDCRLMKNRAGFFDSGAYQSLATSSESLINLAISSSSVYPGVSLRNYVDNDLNSSIVQDVNPSFDVIAITNKFPAHSELIGDSGTRPDFQSYPFPENVDSNGWMSANGPILGTHYPYTSHELSLSLASYQPSVTSGPNDQAQCSEISSSVVTRHFLNEPGQTSSNCKDLSLSFSSTRQYSGVILGSRYLNVIQEILGQVASYSLENLDLNSYSAHMTQLQANMSFSTSYGGDEIKRGSSFNGHEEFLDADGRLQDQAQPAVQRRALETKKTQLLNLLEEVDDQYSHCLDEIHTVVSAFHAATELDPQIHTRFALQTVSFLYKNLRERISNQILSLGRHNYNSSELCLRENEQSPESLFIHKRWALQQLKRKDQLWKPQRGLPERSVSVLRTWMFQNFLHPYPKDAEKHLLAMKSGLSKGQVSNWFINARVRLWKPMIEEMHAEINRRKAKQNEEDKIITTMTET
ncbi:hypothetical protein ACFE04_015402 [Oxalis oulophora]